MSEWKEYRIEDLALDSPHAMATGPFGSAISSKFFQEEGVPVIRGGNLSTDVTDQMSDDGLVFVSEEKASEFKRSIVRPGDLIFTCWGTINQVGLITEELRYSEYIISNKQMKLTVDPKKADPLFLYYLFSSPLKQAEILNNGIGAAVPGFNLGQLKAHLVNLPSVEKQREISSFINSFDRKIRHNRQTNQTLEQIAQVIFKSWFVDFEPTRAKMQARAAFAQGKMPEGAEEIALAADLSQAEQDRWVEQAAMAAISGKSLAEIDQLAQEHDVQGGANVAGAWSAGATYEQLKTTAALFPDTLVDSELGEIPEGWSVGTLDDLCSLNNASWTKKNAPEEVWYVDLANTKNGVIEDIQHFSWDEAPSRARRILNKGDTLIGTVRPGNRSFTIIGEMDRPLTASTGFAVLTPLEDEYAEFIFVAATSDESIDRLAHLADGGAYPAVRPDVVTSMELKIPTGNVMKAFSDFTKPFFDKRDRNLISQSTFENMREALLPKLLSGDLEVK